MKKLFASVFALVMGFAFTSCNEEGPTDSREKQQAAWDKVVSGVKGIVSTDRSATGADESVFGWTLKEGGTYNSSAVEREVVEGNITVSATWTKDKIWVVKKRVTVLDGVVLTIEAGTRVEGDVAFTGPDASVLMIAIGGKIMAEGTADEPIIMTASDESKKWGGLVVLGDAPISIGIKPQTQIEGVVASDKNGLYGGSDPEDNSGIIKYVSIRHGGAILDAAAGNEINGLSLGGVGSGTVIENIEVFDNSDDGVEFFGGSVDVKNILVARIGDDGVDIDQSYSGTVSNVLIYVDSDSDEGLEIDGREGGPIRQFNMKDVTVVSDDGSLITCDFKTKAQGHVSNLNANGSSIKLAASFDEVTYELTEDAAKNVIDENLTFSKVNGVFSVYTHDLPALNEQ